MADERVSAADIEISSAASARDVPSTPEMGWLRASVIGLGVFVYFVVFTVWFPSKLIRLEAVASSAQWIQDLTVTGSWFAALIVGLVGLRRAQRRGWI